MLAGLTASGIIVVPAQAALTPVWEAQDDMPANKTQAGIALGEDGLIYVFGGVDTVTAQEYDVTVDTAFAFDPSTGSWHWIANMQYGSRACAAIAGEDGKLYVFGGYNESWGPMAYAQIYDPVLDSWSLGTNMPFAEAFVTGAKGYDGQMVVIGGTSALGRVQIYDPVGDSWSLGTNMASPMWSGTCVAVNDGNEIFYIGGSNNWGSASTLTQVYSVYWNSWSTVSALPSARTGATATLGADGLIYLIGGGNTAYNTGGTLGGQLYYDSTLVYCRSNNTWFSAVDLPYAPRYGMSASTPDGKVWFFGGNSNTDTYGRVSMLEIARITISLSSNTVAQGDSVLLFVDPQFAYATVRQYYLVVYLESPTGFTYDPVYVNTVADVPFVLEIQVPEIAEVGAYTIVMNDFFYYTPEWWNMNLPLTDLTLAVQPMVPLEDLIADLEAQIAALQADLDAQTASVAALQAQLTVMQAQLAAIGAALAAMAAGQTASMDALNTTFAGLQAQLDDFQEQIDRVEDKADTAGTYGIVTMVLVIIIVVLVGLMIMMARKKP